MLKKIAISFLSVFVIMTSCYYVAFSDYYMEDVKTTCDISLPNDEEPILVAYNDETEHEELNLAKKQIEIEYINRYEKNKEKFLNDIKGLVAKVIDGELEDSSEKLIEAEAKFENECRNIHADMRTLLTCSGYSTEAVNELESCAVEFKREAKLYIIREAAFKKRN